MACSLSYISSITGDCSNLSLGSFSIDIQGDAPGYTIQWLSPDYGTIPLGVGVSGYTTGYTINSLSAGTYSFNILDSCISPGITTVPVNIYISSGTCVSITNQRNTTCNFNNGSITAQTQYQYGTSKFYLYENTIGYLSSGSTLNSNFSFNSLSPGIYYVIGDDGGGCTGKSETCIIKSSTTLDYGFYVVNDAGCNVNSGKIFVTGLIGNPPYTYLWSNGGTLSSITGLTNGPYSVTVTDNTGCSISKSTEVVKVPQIGLGGFTSISPGCFTNNGELTVFITGGTAPYYYSASTGESNVSFDPQYTFTNVPGGSISVYAQDAGLCSFVASTTLQTPSGFNVVSVNVVNSKCGYSNGIISILLNGTNGNIVYTLTDSNNDSIENETSSLSWSFNNLKSDTYTLTISNGVCVYTNTYTVINESLYDINILTTGTTCNTPNGVVNIEIVGGIPPYTINIGSQSLIGTSLSSVTFTNLVSDSYVVQITDSSPTPCRQTQSFEIDSSENVGVLLVKTDIINVNDGTINVYITGGTPTFDLQWSSNVNGQTGYSITNLSAGTYTLIVTDSDNCVKETSIKIYGYDKLSSYESYTICDSDFEDIGELGKYGIYEMYYDGYYTHVSGFTNCILDSATFKLIVTIGNVEKYNDFYVSNSLTDYPFDNEYYDVLKGLVDSFDQVSQTIIDPISNQIQIITKCDEEFLVPARVVVSLDIDYSISCQDCGSVPSLSPTVTPTPTPTPTPTDPPIISLCDVNYSIAVNKGVDCGLYIQGIQPNCQLASLSVGALSSRSGCTIGTYVIDWYLNDINGSPSFTSGSDVNASSDVTVVQPFSDEPAEGGTWFPVIRFAYLNGIQYTSDINLVNGSVKYSPDFSTIIDSVCVEAFTCSSGIQGNTYPVTVSYLNTTQNSTRAERSISWDLSPITKNFAWAFKGFSIYDTISIRYISPTNNINSQIENWKVGFDAGTNSLTSNPKVYSYGLFPFVFPDTLKLVTSLTGFTYTNGDYLLINVMPNPTISNTNWGFSGKCLTDTASLDCGSLFNGNLSKDGYNFSNITSTFNPSTCNLTISGITRNSPIYTATTSNNNFFKYHGTLSGYLNNPIWTTQLIPNFGANVEKRMVSSNQAGGIDRGCLNQISGTTINKSGATITLTFDDITDYNVYKTQYNNVLNHSTFTNYVNDPSNINYYKYVTLGVLSGTTCGDTLGVTYIYETHVSSPFIFDDLNNKLTVILLPPINGYTSGETCNNAYSSVNNRINLINYFISAPNYTFKTYVRRGESIPSLFNAVGGISVSMQQINGSTNESIVKIVPKPNVCYSSTDEWCFVDGFYLSSYLYNFSTTVTDITDPANNFKIQNMLDSNGCTTFPWTLLYEISNGIVIFPI